MTQNTTILPRLLPRLTLLLATLALAWPATRASAQFTFAVSPLTAPQGTTEVTYFGTLTNIGTSDLSFNDAVFTPLSGPAGVDLTTFGPFIYDGPTGDLIVGQPYIGPLFTVDMDPNLPLGLYTSNIAVTYGAPTVGRDVTLTLGSPVPEAGTLPLLALGAGYIGFALRRRKQQAAS